MSSFKLPASLVVTTLLLASFNASAQITSTPAMQAPAGATSNTGTPVSSATVNRSSIDSQGSGAIPSLPLEVQNSNGITYINGGIGDEEVAELKAKEKEFNVHVLLNAPQGAFISSVTLDVLDSKGSSLLTVSDAGPYFYAKMPAGSYTLKASAAGELKSVPIKVTKNGNVKKQIVLGKPEGIVSPHKPTATIE